MAFKLGGKPVYVMPLVFGFAPVVNTIVTGLMSRTIKQASLLFYLGVLIVAVGAAGVMYFKPTGKIKKAELESNLFLLHAETENSEDDSSEEEKSSAEENKGQPTEAKSSDKTNSDKNDNYFWVFASVAATALCWGAYGPVLHLSLIHI